MINVEKMLLLWYNGDVLVLEKYNGGKMEKKSLIIGIVNLENEDPLKGGLVHFFDVDEKLLESFEILDKTDIDSVMSLLLVIKDGIVHLTVSTIPYK